MKRTVDELYSLDGSANAALFTTFKTDLFANGDTPAVSMNTATANGISVTAVTTTAFRVTGNATSAFSCLTGTFTNGLSVGGTVTTGVTVGACTTAFNLTGAATSAFQVTSGAVTNVINILAATNITNFIKFNAAAGCVISADPVPADTPSGGGLGADGCIQIAIGAEDFYIPYFATYNS